MFIKKVLVQQRVVIVGKPSALWELISLREGGQW